MFPHLQHLTVSTASSLHPQHGLCVMAVTCSLPVDILDNKKHFFKSVSTQLVLPEDIARERGFPREASCCNYVIRTGKCAWQMPCGTSERE